MLYKIIRKIFIIISISAIIGNTYILVQNSIYNKAYQKTIKSTEITGIIVSSKEEKNYYDKYIIKVKSNSIRSYKYILYVKKGSTTLKYGDKIKFIGEYQEPEGARNYKGFNYKDYLKTKKIYGSFKAGGNIEILEHNKLNPISIFINNIRDNVINNVNNLLPEEQSGILLGLILGKKDEIAKEDMESFKLSSMSHILSVSGMHISYIVFGLTYILNKFPKRKRYIITILGLLFFMVLTRFQPSVVRAVIMASMILIAKLLYRREDFLSSIFLSLLILCLYNPFLIKDVGLQLSFLGTLGIVIFAKRIDGFLCLRFNKKISNILAVGISAQILILPVLIYNFNLLSISFLLSNFISSILAGIIFIYGAVLIIISLISIKISKNLSMFLSLLIMLLKSSAENIANIQLFNHIVKTPIMLEIIIYYLIVIVIKISVDLLMRNKQDSRRYEKKIVKKLKNTDIKKIILSVIVFLLILFIANIIYKSVPQNLKVYFIDVGQGDSCLIRTPKDKTILIDGGEDEDTVFNYLLDRRITKLDYVVISHFDSDHVRWHF